jgi:hypothetical protein
MTGVSTGTWPTPKFFAMLETNLLLHLTLHGQALAVATENLVERRLRTTSSNQLRAIQLERIAGRNTIIL